MKLHCFGLLFLFLVSCASSTEEKEKASQRTFGPGIVISENEYPSSLHPHEAIHATNTRVLSQVYEGLTRFNAKGDSIQLCLAKSYTVSEQGRRYIFQLKDAWFHPNICFGEQESRKVVAQDIVNCINSLKRTEGKSLRYIFGQNLLEVKANSSTEVEFNLEHPDDDFLAKLATPAGYIYPKEAESFYRSRFDENPVGTGPFCLKSRNDRIENHLIVLTANENYHEKTQPLMAKVTFRYIYEKQTEFSEFMEGNIDLIHHLDTSLVTQINEDGDQTYEDYRLDSCPELSLLTLGFNLQYPVVQDIKLRQAVKSKLLFKLAKSDSMHEEIAHLIPLTEKDSSEYFLSQSQSKNDWKQIVIPYSSTDPQTARLLEQIRSLFNNELALRIESNALPLYHYDIALHEKETPVYYQSFDFLYPSIENFYLSLYGPNQPYPNLSTFNNADYNLRLNKYNGDTLVQEKLNRIIHKEIPLIPLQFKTNHYLSQFRVKNYQASQLPYLDLRNVEVVQSIKALPVIE